MTTEENKYFFSYARKDSGFVRKLAEELRTSGVNLWLDQLDILGGEHWDKAVENALKACKGMIIVLSVDSVKSNNVMDEVSYAIGEGKRIIPVICRDCDVPFRLRRIQYVDFTGDYEKGFRQLLSALGIEQTKQFSDTIAPEGSNIETDTEPIEKIPVEKTKSKKTAHSVKDTTEDTGNFVGKTHTGESSINFKKKKQSFVSKLFSTLPLIILFVFIGYITASMIKGIIRNEILSLLGGVIVGFVGFTLTIKTWKRKEVSKIR